ncbi:MAG: flavin reductase [Verrucomicrobia bacterium]|nr:flavin reductase [Verrucomicrobiota bacterium]
MKPFETGPAQSCFKFGVPFPSEQMGRETLHVGSHHGRGRDTIAECGLATQPATVVRALLIADAMANFECELVDVYRPGDCPLVIGKVLAAHENADATVKRLYTVGPGHTMGGVRPA